MHIEKKIKLDKSNTSAFKGRILWWWLRWRCAWTQNDECIAKREVNYEELEGGNFKSLNDKFV